MLQAITLLAAMSATTGLMGHGKQHCGGVRMHHARTKVAAYAMPTSTCGAMTTRPTMMSAPLAPMMSAQAPSPTSTMGAPTAPVVYPTPSQAVPPAPPVPPNDTVPAAPAPPAPPST